MAPRDDPLAEEEIGLDELAAPAPDENPDEQGLYHHDSLESSRRQPVSQEDQKRPDATSKWLTQLYIVSYLILFSIFGVLARLGLQALTLYPGAIITNTDVWANFAGSLLMGMLREDRTLFRRHWEQALEKAGGKRRGSSEDTNENPKLKETLDAAGVSYASAKGSLPAYIGLTVGFCGSFTSFASICRDSFLAISNNLNTSVVSTTVTTAMHRSRPNGDSVMAILAVLIIEVGLGIVALNCGAHLATGLARTTEKIPALHMGRVMNALVVVLGPGCWLGVVLMTIWPPHDAWRERVLFSIVFAPVGCLLRFQLSVHMNRIVRSFPLGTFTANIVGTCILGMAYDLQMSSAGTAIVSCQVLQGIMDGFCGALTTVSTWVLELDTLRLKHAYFYGLITLAVGVGCITTIMGSLEWTEGFKAATCKA